MEVKSSKGENAAGILMDYDNENNAKYDMVIIDTGENDLNDLKYDEYSKISEITKAESMDGFTQKDMCFSSSKPGSSVTINSTGTLVYGNNKINFR